jgi:selenocysteine-specific elongation factor
VSDEAVGAARVHAPSPSGLAPAGYQVQLSARQETEARLFLDGLAGGRYSPPTENMLSPALLALLESRRQVVTCAAGIAWDAAVFGEMVERVTAHIREHGQVSLGEVRDLFDTSRKYAQAFLEHLDQQRVTRRQGDARVLR